MLGGRENSGLSGSGAGVPILARIRARRENRRNWRESANCEARRENYQSQIRAENIYVCSTNYDFYYACQLCVSPFD